MCTEGSTYFRCGCWASHSPSNCGNPTCKTITMRNTTLRQNCEQHTLKAEWEWAAAKKNARQGKLGQ